MNPEIDWEVTVADGKYTLQHFENGGARALRYGEPWRDCVGDNLVIALGMELSEAREKIKELTESKTAKNESGN